MAWMAPASGAAPVSSKKSGQPPRQTGQMLGRQRAPAKQCLGAVLVREPSHADAVVDDLALGAEPVALRAEPDRDDPEIDVGREPPVQPHLVLAAAPASLERRVVHEPIVDGPLELPASRSVRNTQEICVVTRVTREGSGAG